MSDIFNEYAKIAIKKGLIKNAEESKELKKYKDDSYPRAGSDTIEIIESLYGVKPEKPKSQEYKDNIMEVAHPNKVILAPSYDKINGLVENNIERQRIMINIVNKPPNGYLTQHKYAAELAKSLMQIANDMDNRNIEPLRKLADTCIEQLHKEALSWDEIKNWLSGKSSDAVDIGEAGATGAVIGGVVGGLIGAFGGPVGIVAGAAAGTAAAGVLAAIFKTGPEAQSVKINAIEAKEKLMQLAMKMPNDLFLFSLEKALDAIVLTAEGYHTLLDRARAGTEDSALEKEAMTYGSKYQTQIVQLDRIIDIFLENAKTGRYDEKEGDWLSKIEKPIDWIFGTKVQDAVRAMEILERANDKALRGIMAARQASTKLKTDMPTAPDTVPATPAAKAAPELSREYLSQLEESFR